jgi:hypothetical protein
MTMFVNGAVTTTVSRAARYYGSPATAWTYPVSAQSPAETLAVAGYGGAGRWVKPGPGGPGTDGAGQQVAVEA